MNGVTGPVGVIGPMGVIGLTGTARSLFIANNENIVVNGLETVSFNVTLIYNGTPDIVQTAPDQITLLTGT